VEDYVVGVHDVAGPQFDPADRLLETGVGEGLRAAAGIADEMVMMLAAGVDELEQRLAPADLKPPERPNPFQLGQDPVDAGGADRPRVLTGLLMQLSCGEPPASPGEGIQHRRPGAAAVEPGRA
jgi:hypothetical protein